MHWHTNARRNRSFHDTGSFIARLRHNQKLNAWPEHFQSLAIALYNYISKRGGFGQSFHLPLSFPLFACPISIPLPNESKNRPPSEYGKHCQHNHGHSNFCDPDSDPFHRQGFWPIEPDLFEGFDEHRLEARR
jgi:hypothetical protein